MSEYTRGCLLGVRFLFKPDLNYPKLLNFGPGPFMSDDSVIYPMPPISVIKVNEEWILVKYEPQLDDVISKE